MTPERSIPKRYRVLEAVSSGSQAAVFKVLDEESGHVRALKLLAPAENCPTAMELFRLEFARVSSLRHPSIVRVHDFGSVESRTAYFVMDYLEGEHFDRALSGQPFNGVADACLRVCEALGYVHVRGMVHGDVKPSNIIVTREQNEPESDPGACKVTLTDFGLARLARDTGLSGGTRAYASPEAIRGLPVDGRADLYSFGAMLYELLTGARLFPGVSGDLLLRAHLLSTPVPPRDVNPSVSPGVQALVMRLLEKNPDRRYQTSEELAEALRDAAGMQQPLVMTTPSAVTLLSPELVGREPEQEMMGNALRSLEEEGRGGFALLSGGHGAGKSRLAEWLRFSAAVRGARVGRVRCGELEPYSGAPRFQWSGRSTGDESADGRGRARAGTREDGALQLVKSIYPSHAEQREPCVLVFEDAHLASPVLLREIVDFVPLTEVFPLFILCTYEPMALDARPVERELLSRISRNPAVKGLTLSPLTRDAVGSLVTSMLGAAPGDVPGVLVDWVQSASHGVPRTAEELVRELVSRGHVRRLGRRLICDLPPESDLLSCLTVPDTLAAQIAGLREAELSFLRAASVAGNVFSLDTITRLLEEDPEQVAAIADRLLEKGIVRRAAPGRYAFSHALTASVVRGLTPVDAMGRLHATMAGLLEEDGSAADASVLALHYELSGQEEKSLAARLTAVEAAAADGRHEGAFLQAEAALPAVRASGRPDVVRRLLERGAGAAEKTGRVARAIDLWQEHLALLPTEEEAARVTAMLKLGRLCLRLSRFQEARSRFLAAIETAAGKALEPLRAEAMVDMAWTESRLLRHEEALGILARAEGLEAARQPRLLALVQNRKGVIMSELGRLSDSEAHLRAAVRLAEQAGDLGIEASSLNNLGLKLIEMGRADEAESVASSACAKAEEAGDLTVLAACYNNLGIARKELLKYDAALDSYLKAMEAWKRCGDFAGSGRTALNVAVLYRLKGEMGPALRYNEESYRLALEFTPDGDRSVIASNIGEIHGMRGSIADAEKYYLEALAIKEKAGDPNGVAACATGLGYVFLRNGEVENAMQWAEKAVAASTDESTEKIAARLLIAEVLASTGRAEEAERQLATVETGQSARLPVFAGRLRRVRGMLEEQTGRVEEALESYRSSCSVLGGAGDALERARSLFCLGRALVARSGQPETACAAGGKDEALKEASTVLDEACRIFERMDAGPEILSCYSALAASYKQALAVSGSQASPDDAATLLRAAELVNSALPCSAVLDHIMDLAIEKTGAERGLIALVNEETGEMEKVLSRALEDEAEQDAFEISRTVVRRVAHGGASLLTADAREDPDLKDVKSVSRLEIRSVLCVPLRARGKAIGAVYLDNRSMPGAFGPRQAGFMEGFADLAGVAVENTRLREELERVNELLSRENMELRRHVASSFRVDQIVGASPEMKAVFAAIEKVARTTATVLIVGESGTGKGLVARAIHSNSSRREGPFVPVDCVAIPKDLIEGELFGIEDRVATGVSKRTGYFEQADGGTLFLDEIGDMSHELQAKLLRVLQEREFRRIGGRHSVNVDVRIICATNKNLLEEYASGRFRADLYHRISGIPIEIPPLRQRKGDIPRLVKFFLDKYCAENGVDRPPVITPDLMRLLVEADWEGNVRQLENCIERFVVMCPPGQEVPFSLLPEQLRQKAAGLEAPAGAPPRRKLKDEKEEVEKRMLVEALVRHNGNRSRAARELGVSEQSVRYKMRKYRLKIH